tara:strand:- start:449 stop:664 length:216 start_codon:yes stop_codon:yes gene_type:complete
MQKIINIISVISFLLVVVISGGGVFGYFWITNEENQKSIKDKIVKEISGSLPIPKGLTGPVIPTGPLPNMK